MSGTASKIVDANLDPSQVRSVILTEHKHLRGLLAQVVTSAEALLAQSSVAHWEKLREDGRILLGRLCNHIELENRILAPALRDTDSYGPLRARTLIEDHAQQRGQLEATLMLLDDPNQPMEGLAQRLLELVADVRADMAHEERDLLDPELLRDSILTTDTFTG